jgi:hypothetical protein
MKNEKIGLSCLLAVCISYLGFGIERFEFGKLIAAYSLAFGAYGLILLKAKTVADQRFFLGFSLILRGVLVFSFPNLSDDIYRFIWDGRLIYLGENPFNHPPQYFIDNQLFTDVLTPDLFSHLNSPAYYSVYPPVCQAVFATAVYLCPNSLYGSVILIKFFLFVCEVGTIRLLHKSSYSADSSHPISPLVYALNPLILLELVGNAHFEAAMIFFFLWASLRFFQTLKSIGIVNLGLTAFMWSLAVAVKMLPLMFLPFVVLVLDKRWRIGFWALVGFFLILLFLPLYNGVFIGHIGKSLGLYFQKFEFNASFYYLMRELSLVIYGWNRIPLITSLFSCVLLVFILRRATFQGQGATSATPMRYGIGVQQSYFFEACLLSLALYYAFATTVHPWYVAFLLALSVLTKWRFPIVWTGVIYLTYAGYTEGSSKHTECYGLVWLEYLAVYGFFLWEFWQKSEKFYPEFSTQNRQEKTVE